MDQCVRATKFFTELYADRGFVGADVIEQAAIAEVVFLSPDVAVARVFARTQGQRLPDGTVIAERRIHNTMTLTREASGWKVRDEVVTAARSYNHANMGPHPGTPRR